MPKANGSGAVIIKADGSMKSYIPNDGKTLTGDEMRKIVGGHIRIVSDGKYSIVICEDGNANGMRPNRRATTIARAMNMIYPLDYIVGVAILCPSSMLR